MIDDLWCLEAYSQTPDARVDLAFCPGSSGLSQGHFGLQDGGLRVICVFEKPLGVEGFVSAYWNTNVAPAALHRSPAQNPKP